MLNKLSPKLLMMVSALKDDKKLKGKNVETTAKNKTKKCKTVDCIIYSNNFKSTKQEINCYFKNKEVCELPFIKAFGINVEVENLVHLAKIPSVKYISSSSRVFTLVDVAKKIIGVKNVKMPASSFTCAVVDTGVYPHFDFLVGKNKIVHFVDFINDKRNFYDDNGHGTIVSSLICGSGAVSGGKYSGVDPNLNIISLKALDKNGEAGAVSILKAMQWIYDNRQKYNIKLVCMSFGSTVLDKNDPLMLGAEILWNNGIVVVSAAGNNGPERETIMSPAASSKIITVGAMDDGRGENNVVESEFKVAKFSSRGPVLNNYKPDLIVSGVDIVGAFNFHIHKKFYGTMSGTSVATPIVTGVCSLLMKKYPNYSPNMIKKLLIDNCQKITGNRND